MAAPFMYLMEIYVGTPLAKQMVTVDTGSDMTWIQCLPCEHCFRQNQPIFNPNHSSSYQVLRGNSNECKKLGDRRIYTRSNEKCKYSLSYDDYSKSYGELAKETYRVGGTSIPNIIHGCGHNNVGVFDELSTGMIGLGDDPLSFFGQIKYSTRGMFSYCLVSNLYARSMINFGNNAVVYGNGVMSTPLYNRRGISDYFLTLKSISVGNRIIQMRRQTGNIIIDTGTTLSYLPSYVLENLKNALRQHIYRRPLNVDGLCYEINTNIPTITFHFDGSANLALSKINTFVEYGNMLCLAIKEEDDISIFGNRAQINFLIGYNIPNRKVYFKPTNC